MISLRPLSTEADLEPYVFRASFGLPGPKYLSNVTEQRVAPSKEGISHAQKGGNVGGLPRNTFPEKARATLLRGWRLHVRSCYWRASKKQVACI